MNACLRATRQWLVAIGLAAAATGAWAQDSYPNQPIKLIVPWPAGGSVDIATRILVDQLAINLGQPVVVDNRPGAAGNIGAAAAAKAAPDGYTLLIATTPMIINRYVSGIVPIDLSRHFTPISELVNTHYVLAVNPAVAGSVHDLVAKAKAAPGTMSYASSGNGTQLHLLGEMFKRQAGVNITHVPYKGGPPALADLVGGHVQMMFPGIPVVDPLIRSGQLKPLAVVSKRRLALLPNVPTLAEAGIPNIDSTEWYGLVAPAGTPDKVVARLAAEVLRVFKTPGVRERLESRGFEPVGGTPKEFAELIDAEQKKWAEVVKQSGVRVD